jgi:hypothetical protein|nr:MAG TPA: hypothetical protein [Caudoviricetes sp.]
MRLIDADAFIRFLAEQRVKNTGMFTKGVNKALNIAISALKNQQITPTVDAVPVVRCKDCKRWQRHVEVNRDYGGCRRYSSTMRYDDFCSCGAGENKVEKNNG